LKVMSFTQITTSASEPLRPIALVSLEPEDFTARYGVEFVDGSDELDFTRSALIEFESGLVTGLLRYARSPEPGTEVHAPQSASDPATQLQEFLAELGLDESDVRWVVSQPATARAGS
jgi:hypothetical protein